MFGEIYNFLILFIISEATIFHSTCNVIFYNSTLLWFNNNSYKDNNNQRHKQDHI